MIIIVRKIIAVVCALFLLWGFFPAQAFSSVQESFAAAPIAGAGSVFDSSYAKITDFSNYSSDTLVINIQDLHCDFNTQIAINQLLEMIYASDKDVEIYVEGAYKNVDLEYYKNLYLLGWYPSFSENLLKNSDITGAEFFALRNKDVVLYPLEDKDIYIGNLKTLAYLMENREQNFKIYNTFHGEAKNSILKLLDPKSVRLINKKDDFDKSASPNHKEYVKALFRHAQKYNIDCPEKYPNFDKSVKAYLLENKFSVSEISKAVIEYNDFLKTALSYKEYADIDNANDQMQAFAEKYGDYSYRNFYLSAYFKQRKLNRDINVVSLLKEEDALFWEILNAQAETSLQLQAVSFLQTMYYAKKLMEGKIYSYEYEKLKRQNGDFFTLFNKFTGTGLPAEVVEYFNHSKKHYDINNDRNDIFIKNAGIGTGKTRQANPDSHQLSDAFKYASTVKILVTGGYHSEALAGILKNRKVSYIVLTPNINSDVQKSELLYKNTILFQAGILSSAMQTLRNFEPMMIENGILKTAAFCSLLLNYSAVDYFEKTPEAGKKAMYAEYIKSLAGEINKELSPENRIESVVIKSVQKSFSSYIVDVEINTKSGKFENTYKVSKNTDNTKKMMYQVLKSFKSVYEGYKFQLKTPLKFEKLKNELDWFQARFELYKASMSQIEDNGDFSFKIPEILKTYDSFYLKLNGAKKLYNQAGEAEKAVFREKVSAAASVFAEIINEAFIPKSYERKVDKAKSRMNKLLRKYGIKPVIFTDINNFAENFDSVYGSIKGDISAYLGDYENTSLSEKYIFKYAVEKLPHRNYNFEDMSFVNLKESYFKNLPENLKPAAKTALKKQSEEIIEYFINKKFGVNNQEEMENKLIRSIVATQISSEYADTQDFKEMLSMSRYLFSEMADPVGLKKSEWLFLSALNEKDPAKIAKYEKEYNDKAEYLRRVAIYQNVLMKAVADIAARSPESFNAARDFFIEIADGGIIKKKQGVEGMFWLRQQAVLRLKNFKSTESESALQRIIKEENRNSAFSGDSALFSFNMESSNANGLSLKLYASSVLFDYKRQDAEFLIRRDIGNYKANLESAPRKERFAYIAAALDVLRNPETPVGTKTAVFGVFSKISDKDIMFAANILFDGVDTESDNFAYAEAFKAFVFAFAQNLNKITGKDVSGILSDIDLIEKGGLSKSRKRVEKLTGSVRFIMGNLGSAGAKEENWISDYSVFMMSGGGVAENILHSENFNLSGAVAGLMPRSDDGGSSNLCRGFNAEKYGVLSPAQGDIVNFITSAAFLEDSKAPLKNIISDFMRIRFDESGKLYDKVKTHEKPLKKAASEKGLDKEFGEFWNKVTYYAEYLDDSGFEIKNNSLKNLLFEAMVLDNMGYGEGYMNPDGIYAAMKDFAGLLGVGSVAVSDMPFGNIMTVEMVGGVEKAGQSYFSHSDNSLKGGMYRRFWDAKRVGYVFEDIKTQSRIKESVKNAKVIVAGLCSWVSSFGIQIADKDLSGAIAANSSADKILITNPVKDNENRMNWRRSTIDFVQEVSGQRFQDMFNIVFAWNGNGLEKEVDGFLTKKDIFDGKAGGGYRGINKPSESGRKKLAGIGVRYVYIRNGIDVIAVRRRDDASRAVYKLAANPGILSPKIWDKLKFETKSLFASRDGYPFRQFLKDTKFADSTALIFSVDALRDEQKAREMAEYGINVFEFIPVSKAEVSALLSENSIKGREAYSSIAAAAGIDVYFVTEEIEGTLLTQCYYIVKDGFDIEKAESVLCEWFLSEAPALKFNKLLKFESISLAESSNPSTDFTPFVFKGNPLKVFDGSVWNDKFNISVPPESTGKYVDAVLKGFEAEMRLISGKIEYFQNAPDLFNEKTLLEFKDFLKSIDAWDNPAARAAMIYAVRSKAMPVVTQKGIKFMSPKGKKLNFSIDANGYTRVSANFKRNMDEVAKIKVFADIDENIAERRKPFSPEMKEIFNVLNFYEMANPVIITGNQKGALMVRFDELPSIIKENLVFYVQDGRIKYEWKENPDKPGEYGFFEDKEFQEVSNAEIGIDMIRNIRKYTFDADTVFDNVFQDFIRKTNGAKTYRETVLAALADYNDDSKLIKLLKETADANLRTKEELVETWGRYSLKEVLEVLKITGNYYFNKNLKASLDDGEYIEMLKIISLLEYSRIIFSEAEEDARNKLVLTNADDIRGILSGEYKKLVATGEKGESKVRYALSPIRVTHIRDSLADLIDSKIKNSPEFKDSKIDLIVAKNGRTTINIYKNTGGKDIAVAATIRNGTNARYVMFSGDEHHEGGADGAVGKMLFKRKFHDIVVVNTNLSDISNKGTVYARKVFKNSGIETKTSTQIGTLIHEMILEELENNIASLAEDDNYQAYNIVQAIKDNLEASYLGFSEIPTQMFKGKKHFAPANVPASKEMLAAA